MIIKHIAHKGADYGAPLEYYTMKHEENLQTGRYTPVLDEHGLKQLRENCRTFYINSRGEDDEPENFQRDCLTINWKYEKNQAYEDVTTHEYIISHDTSDRFRMSDEDLEEEARIFAKKYAKGYPTLISIHRDTDDDHIHITINSVRELEREPQQWMVRGKNGAIKPCETVAGGKHQQSTTLRCDMNDWALEYARGHGLLEEDNNAKAKAHTEERYRGRNAELRDALRACADQARDLQSLEQLLRGTYGVTLIVRGQTISLRHPDAKKATRLRSLGLSREELDGLLAAPPTGKLTRPYEPDKWERCLKDDEHFWTTLRLSRSGCQQMLDQAYAQLRVLNDLRRMISDSEWALTSRKTDMIGRWGARRNLKNVGDPKKIYEEIRQRESEIEACKQLRERNNRAAEVYRLYAAQAREAIRLRNETAYERALERMEETRRRVSNSYGVVTKEEIKMEQQRLEEMRACKLPVAKVWNAKARNTWKCER